MAGNVFDGQLFAIAEDQVQRVKTAVAVMEKNAFVDAQETQGAAGGGPPGGAPGGGDPGGAMGGAGMPTDPMAALGAQGADPTGAMGGGLTEDRVRQLIQESAAVQGGAGAAPGAAGGGALGKPKMKLDVNTEIYHVKRLLVAMMNFFKIPVSPDILLGDPAEDPYAAPGEAAADPASAGAAPGASVIPPIQPMQGASPAMAAGGMDMGGAGGAGGGQKMSHYHDNGEPIDEGLLAMSGRSSAIAELVRQAGRK